MLILKKKKKKTNHRRVQKEATELYVQHKHSQAKNQAKQNLQTEERDPRDTHPSRRRLWVAELRLFKNKFLCLPIVSLFIFLQRDMDWLKVENNSHIIFPPLKK